MNRLIKYMATVGLLVLAVFSMPQSALDHGRHCATEAEPFQQKHLRDWTPAGLYFLGIKDRLSTDDLNQHCANSFGLEYSHSTEWGHVH